jgi:hypothetical protein
MDRWLRPVAIGIALVFIVVFFVFPLFWIARLGGAAFEVWQIWRIYAGYVSAASNLTGLNQYLVTALAILLFLPFYLGVHMVLSSFAMRPRILGGEGLTPGEKRRKRFVGAAILVVLAVAYNLSLYYLTKEMAFAFSTGAPQKWYALTPAGVRFFDRPGVDPEYGVPLKPVTPRNIHRLRLAQKGEFKPVDPSSVLFFNPITGDAQVWYYQYPDGALEFYDKPGFHPVTGTPLQPVTQQIYFEWRKTQKAKTSVVVGQGGTPSAPVAVGGQPTKQVLSVRSDPQGADAYLDWKAVGATPVTLEGRVSGGLLVVVREGRQAGFRRLTAAETSYLEFSLPPESSRSRVRLLLVMAEGLPGDSFAALRTRLVEEGFTVLGPEEATEFQQEVARAGGLSHRGLRAWARSRFDTDLVVTARFRETSRPLGDQELSYLGIREAVKGAVRSEASVDLDVVDLRSGDYVTAVSTKGSGIAMDQAQGSQKARAQAAAESSKLLRQRLRG